MTSETRDELFICQQQSNKAWQIIAQSTAVIYQPGNENRNQPKITLKGETTFEIEYANRSPKERYQFSLIQDQWLLLEAEITSGNETMAVCRTETGLRFSTADVTVESPQDITLSDFHINLFPKTMEQAKEWLHDVESFQPVLPSMHRLSVSSGGSVPVYSGPDAKSVRGAKGKAAVSLAEAFDAFGTMDGWTMIHYQVSAVATVLAGYKRN